jgi:peptidoglycan-associated lipoprotein
MRRACLWALAAAIATTSACSKKAVKKPVSDARTQEAPGRLPEPDIRGVRYEAAPSLGTVRFGFDRHHLENEALETLKANRAAIEKNPQWEVLIEGHCDGRGTVEYNLALGQKRAQAVRDYYLLLGVPGDRVATISYGEERPACTAQSCWAANRRAEHRVRAP